MKTRITELELLSEVVNIMSEQVNLYIGAKFKTSIENNYLAILCSFEKGNTTFSQKVYINLDISDYEDELFDGAEALSQIKNTIDKAKIIFE